ncbi:IspD/TarI family cytidylyltransferase [Mesoaciditoga lauensis]|uniref:IspD/TarI family cytidylyltransferase n=1 Tax=Mesoaciditoga lauensis TaxID=1495039 RepID=UPI0005655A88|nr:IspD/TarI family cytidylyltransferase [Mesoaciditoga lauensis]
MTTAIILCAGSSTRFSQGKSNKTLQMLNEKPIFMYSVEKFFVCGVEKIILVVKKEEKPLFEKFLPNEGDFSFAVGGNRRQDSVMNALKLVEDEEKVLIHDGARPLISVDLINRVKNKVAPHACVIPVIPSEDTLRIEKYGKLYTIDRNSVFRIQTPQGCLAGELKELYEKYRSEYFYDDAAAFEKAGLIIRSVEGSKENIKITTNEDLIFASFLLDKVMNGRKEP